MIEPLHTERLILREWHDDDLLPFYDLNADQKVMAFFPKVLNREQSDEYAWEIQNRLNKSGWGLWAVEEKASGNFIGFVGLNQPEIEFPFSPCIEIGWRLAKEYWGKGYATEAGGKSLEYAFDILSVDEVVSFTAVTNKRSEAVMKRLGMENTNSNFNHPLVPNSSELCEHVLYKITRKQWQEINT